MKRMLLVVLAAALPAATFAADTAYTALRVVGKKNGEDSLGRVVEVRGRFGSPEPTVWKVVVAEPGGRGVREYEVQHGRISGERAPTGRAGGSSLDLNKLNIDSEGAFTIVNQEAQKSGLPFDRVDYALNSGARGGVPTWHVELYDGRNGRVGTMEIAADSGDVLNRNLQAANRRAPAADDRAYLRDRPAPEQHREVVEERRGGPDDRAPMDYADDRRRGDDTRVYDDERRGPDDGRVYADNEEGPGITDLFGKIGRHFEHRGRQLKGFFSR